MSEVILGSNDFLGVPFPLVLADRFFHMYDDGGRFHLDVFRWDEKTQAAVYDVQDGEGLLDNISSNPTGIVTFSREDDGTFLYKFRPKPGVSQIFGKVPVDREVEVHISDRSIVVSSGENTICTFTRNQIAGRHIGIEVGADGGISMGVNRLPKGMLLKRA